MTSEVDTRERPATGSSSTSIRMSLRFEFGDPYETVIEWPAEWRVPEVGEHVRLDPGWAGKVAHVQWDYLAGIVHVIVRATP